MIPIIASIIASSVIIYLAIDHHLNSKAPLFRGLDGFVGITLMATVLWVLVFVFSGTILKLLSYFWRWTS